jgi:hypothetical protein
MRISPNISTARLNIAVYAVNTIACSVFGPLFKNGGRMKQKTEEKCLINPLKTKRICFI